MPEEISSAIILFVGTILGGGLAVSGQFFLHALEKREKRSVVAHAIAAEIEAYLSLVAKRSHVDLAKAIIKENAQGRKTIPKDFISGFEVNSEQFMVIKSVMPNIGILGTLAEDVVKFYNYVHAVRCTIINAQDGKYDNLPPETLAKLFTEELDLWNETEADGRRLIKVLRLQ